MQLIEARDLQRECVKCRELTASVICRVVLLEVALAMSERPDERDLKILKNSLDQAAPPRYG